MFIEFKLNDVVKLNEDEAQDLENDVEYSTLDWNENYQIVKIDDSHGLNHYTLKNINTDELVYYKENIPYGFIDAEIVLVKHTQSSHKNINHL